MNDSFHHLAKKDRHQVFLFSCPANFPFSFAPHPWFLINAHGTLSRWEVFWRPQYSWKLRWGHLHKDFYPPFSGISVLPFDEKGDTWQDVELIGRIEDRIAEAMRACIESSPHTYPHRDTYALRGPNSNTYVQWVLDQFPECNMKLPWSAFGKSYTTIGRKSV